MTDSILLVREAKTCSYVVIVQTPRLCGEPGFKSRAETPEQTFIRCRQIISSSLEPGTTHLQQRNPDDRIQDDFDQPSHLGRETRFAVPSPAAKSSLGPGVVQSEDPWDGILKRTVEATVDALMHSPEFQSLSGENAQVVFARGENGEIIIEIVEEIPLDTLGGEPGLQEGNKDNYADLTELLRKFGHQSKDGDKDQEDDEATEGQGESEESRKRREEL